MTNQQSDELSHEEWGLIEERAVRRDFAIDEEVKALFDKYREHKASDSRPA